MTTFTNLIARFSIILLCVLSMPCFSYSATLTVSIQTTPDQAALPFEVGFGAIVTGGTAPYSFTWNFGDSITSSLASTSHIYRESGQYTVWVVAADSQGSFGVANKTISVGGGAGSFDPQNIQYQVFTNTNELTSLIQDRIDPDVLWVGTTGGLVRYQKANRDYTLFIQELPSPVVCSVSQQSNGILWVGTYSGGLTRFDPAARSWTTFNPANSGLPDKNVQAILPSVDGKIWIATRRGGLARFDPGANAWTSFNTSNSGLPSNDTYALVQGPDGKIWVGTRGGGLARFDLAANAWTTFTTANSGLPSNEVTALLQGTDGKIWAGTAGGGLACFDPVSNAWITFSTASAALPHNWVNFLLQAVDGKIWVTTDDGLARFDPAANAWTTFNTTNSGLSSNAVFPLAQAVDGKIWVGMWWGGGLARFDPEANAWATFNISNNMLPNYWVLSLMQTNDGKIWAGTERGGLVRLDPGANAWTALLSSNGVPANTKYVYGLLQTADGKIWVGTWGGGVTRFDPGANVWTTFNAANSGLPSDWVSALLRTADGKIWVGTSGSGLARFDPAAYTWTTFNTAGSGLPDDAVSALLQSADGKIWVGTYSGGLVRFDPAANSWTTFNTVNSGLPSNSVSALLQSADGKVWVGTYSSGLARFDPAANGWTTLNTTNSGLPDNSVSDLMQSADGKIWVGTYSGGLARFDSAANGWTTFNAASTGLLSNEIHALLQSNDGSIWVGTYGGLVKMTFQQKRSSSAGRLVLVAGGGAAKTNTLWYTTKELASTAYRVFSNRGFSNTDIYFISPEKTADFNGDGIDDHIVDCPLPNEDRNPTVQDLRYAITDWAVKNYSQGLPLYIYLIDHGWPDDGQHGPYFQVAPGQLLYAKDLNEMLNSYEQATGGQVIVINESCYSGQFLSPLMKAGRIVIASTADKMVNYDNFGANSFTNFFLQKLFENDSLQQGYAKASNMLVQRALTKDQRPQLDDNGDGKSNAADGVIAASLKLGGDFNTGAAWPQILTVAKGALSGNVCSFTATTNVHMRWVWASVQPPNYAPDASGSYQKIELETFDLTDPSAALTYAGTYQKFTIPGTYIVTIYARDQFGNTAVSDTIGIDVGMTDRGAISGSVNLQLGNYQVSPGDAAITVMIIETDTIAPVDVGGRFSITGLPAGTYTLRIFGPLFSAVTISNVSVTAGQIAALPTPIVVKIAGPTTPGDVTGDNKIGLDDVIYMLQILSDQRK